VSASDADNNFVSACEAFDSLDPMQAIVIPVRGKAELLKLKNLVKSKKYGNI